MTPDLVANLARLVDDDPEAVVLLDGYAGAGPAGCVTRRRLSARAAAWRDLLTQHRVGRGDCVAVWLPNWSEAVAIQYAALAVGAHVIGVNTRYNVDEVAHVLRQATPKLLAIAHDFQGLDLHGRLHESAAAAGASPVVVVVTGPAALPAPRHEVDGYDVGGGAHRAPDPGDARLGPVGSPDGATLAVAFTTSGSTGRAKLAAHCAAGVAEHLQYAGARMGLQPRDLMLGALPLSGVFGFSSAMAAINAGAAVLLEPVFSDTGVLDDMATLGVTHVVGGDDLTGRLMDAWRAHGRPDLALRWIGLADFEGRSREVARWAETEFGAVATGVYGSSELFALLAIWPAGTPRETRHDGGGQLVMPSAQVRTVDPVTGKPTATGDEGELCFRGPNVVDCYLGTPDLLAANVTDGWFHSGDLGRLEGPDTFRYVCRLGDSLRLRGFLVDPAEIEWRLAEHPAVRVAKVVGTPGLTGGTVAVAFVVLTDGAPTPSQDDLRAWCAQTLAAFKVPSAVRFLKEMPTTSGTNGTKIRAATLRDLARKDTP